MAFDLQTYYERIGLTPEGNETQLELMRKIHQHHITHIAFENIEGYMDRPVNISLRAAFKKLVKKGRGGYCYEHNGILAAALNAVGIKTYCVLACVNTPMGFANLSHQMGIAVADGERYLVDVGFGGDCYVFPLPFKTDIEQTDGINTYRIQERNEPSCQYVIQILQDGQFVDMIGFMDYPARECDFDLGNFFNNFNDLSFFRHHLTGYRCTMDGGKYTLFDHHATYTKDGVTEHYELTDEEVFAFLREKLLINLDGVALTIRNEA